MFSNWNNSENGKTNSDKSNYDKTRCNYKLNDIIITFIFWTITTYHSQHILYNLIMYFKTTQLLALI